MPEKEIAQRKAAGQEEKQEGGKTLAAPAFQLMAGDGGDAKGGSGGSAAVVQKKDEKAKAPVKLTTTKASGYNIHRGTSAIVTIPQNATGVLPIMVIVGGKSFATKEWMKDQIPENYFKTHIMSFSNYGTYYTSGVKPDIEAAMAKDSVAGSYKAILGFSAGGYRVEGAKNDEKWSFLGMIDPVVFDGATYPCPIYMVWNLWEDFGLDDDARSKLDKRVHAKKVAGESVRDNKVGHPGMPKRWFELYGGLL